MSKSSSKYAGFGYRQRPEEPAELNVPKHVAEIAAVLDMNKYEVEFLLHKAQEEAPHNEIIQHQIRGLLSATKLLFSEEAQRHVAEARMHEAAFVAALNMWKHSRDREAQMARELEDNVVVQQHFRRTLDAYDEFVNMLRAGANTSAFTAQENKLIAALRRNFPDIQLELNRSYVFFQRLTLVGPAPKLTPGAVWFAEASALLLNPRMR